MVGHAPEPALRRSVVPTDALDVVARGYSDHALVDFDETLWLRSSTEVYLAAARPRLLAFAILAVVDLLQPWRVLPGPRRRFVYRDWLRVLSVSILLPWSIPLWRRRAPALGRRLQNGPLIEALNAGAYSDVLIVTHGFRPVVAPLLQGVNLSARLAVAGSFGRGYQVRRAGKRASLERITPRALERSLCISDSNDDADLLAACGEPVLVQWPEARHERAFQAAYFPFLYTRKGKRAGQKYLLHNVVLGDILILCLAFAWTVEHPLQTAMAIVLLHGSLWIVYEIGYHENDTFAVLRERAPYIPPGTAAYAERMKPRAAWVCAALLSLPGALLLGHYAGEALTFSELVGSGWMASAAMFVLWLLYLCASRLAYWMYNRTEPAARVFPYAVLHMFRTLGYGLFLLPTLVGALALAALLLGRWIPYVAYRDVGTHLSASPRLLNLFAMIILLVMGLVVSASEILTIQTPVVLGWLVARAHRPLRQLVHMHHPSQRKPALRS